MTLKDILSASLPDGHRFEILNLQSVPRETAPITFPKLTPKSHENASKTVKAQHFIAISYEQKVVFALEIIVYFTLHECINQTAERLIFISKADTNGYCQVRINIGEVTKSIIAYILSISPQHYLDQVKPLQRDRLGDRDIITRSTSVKKALTLLSERTFDPAGLNTKIPIAQQDLYDSYPVPKCIVTKISLFTRAEPEYLFSNSSRNPDKHILSGDSLLNWWLKIIDHLLVGCFDGSTKATLQIPGEETRIISKYLRSRRFQNWTVGEIFSKSTHDIALYTIPLLPDDPKGRFLEHLINDGRIFKVSVSTFWTELQARQEFRLGSTVSVIGVSGKYIGPVEETASNDILIPASKKEFRNIKNYITGEEYDTEEGAEEAYMNLRDILKRQHAFQMTAVLGTYKKHETEKHTKHADISLVNTLTVHRKPKN